MNYRSALIIVFKDVLISARGGGVSPSQKENFSESTLLQAPSDSDRFFYAVGEADTVRLAKNNALGDISSRISVSISSSIDNRLSVSREGGRESSSQDIQTRVNAVAKTIEFSGVSILKSQDDGGIKRVLIKVDREILYQSYLKKLQRIDEKILNEMELIKASSVFYQLKLSYKTKESIRAAQEHLLLLEAMKTSFDDKEYRAKYTRYEETLAKIRSGAVFSIKADKNSQALARVIKSHLSDENIKISENQANVRLHLSTSAEEKHYKTSNAKLEKMKIVIRRVTIKAVDKRGVSLSNNIISTKAASSISKEEAISQTKQYEKMIQEEGIIPFLSGKE